MSGVLSFWPPLYILSLSYVPDDSDDAGSDEEAESESGEDEEGEHLDGEDEDEDEDDGNFDCKVI